jgi:hypothetical protein
MVAIAAFVPDYSGGSAVELHHASLFSAHLGMRTPFVDSVARRVVETRAATESNFSEN